MSKTKNKIDGDTLEIENDPGSTKYRKSRTEINTAIFHKAQDRDRVQLEIDELQAELDILDV